MSDRTFFVDTNILVYAHDAGSGARHLKAKTLIRNLWEDRSGALSTQVLQEFRVTIGKKAANPLPTEAITEIIKDYLTWHIVVTSGTSILEAMAYEDRYGLSFWDALIVQAANVAGASILYSEDMNSGQTYGQTQVLNPFL